MLRKIALAAGPVALAFATMNPASAAITWNEQTNGDLSGDRFNPTPITLGLGTNSLIGSTVTGDLDYFTITLPADWQLDHLILVSYTGDNSVAFIGVQEGPIFTVSPQNATAASLLGYVHFGVGGGNVGTDILDDMGFAAFAIGFTPPLHEGQYTFWVQQTSTHLTGYQFDFIVSPSPSALALLTLAGVTPRRRRSLETA